MTLTTDLNVSPFHADYSNETEKDYYQVLFRPGVAVQAREINNLQFLLQKQIERFGDNIFKRGTIIDGCAFQFYTDYPYIKINDVAKDGTPAAPSNYVGYFVKSTNNSLGMIGYVINYEEGFETTSPDMKTLYLNYINAGANGTVNAFSPGEIITVYDPTYPIFAIKANNGGISFSNNDELVVTPSIVVNVSSGTFTNNEYMYQPDTGANVKIISIDANTLATSNQVILKISARDADLTDINSNSSIWTIANNLAVRNTTNTVTATVESVVGTGLDGVITTDSTGKIIDVVVTDRGQGYTILPTVSVKSPNNTTGVQNLSLVPKNYYANLTISSTSNSVGSGYAFGVGEGVIYQKGYFEHVSPQTIIVEKYNQSPNSVVVGFDTIETIVDYNVDSDLLDNATGTPNHTAPGASRLQLTPVLVKMTSDAAKSNDSFFTLTEWSEGRPFRQNKTTAYNKINDEMAIRSKDESGNFVTDRFEVTTRSPANSSFEGNTVSVIVDPGIAYIDGYRVQTRSNYSLDIAKGLDVKTTNNHTISLNYGNFVRVWEVGGVFQFNTGDTVTLYDTAKTFIANTLAATTGNTNPVGNAIGTAHIRSMVHIDGKPGTSTAAYNLYLFNIQMNAGKNFKDVRSIYYNGTNKGICDVNLTFDPTTQANIAAIESPTYDSLLFYSGVYSLKSSSNNTYTYRSLDQTLTVSNTAGTIVKDISGTTDEYFLTVGALDEGELDELYIVPTSNGLTSSANLTGKIAIDTGSANVTGNSTTFLVDLQAGDYIKSANATANSINQISKVVNNTFMMLTAVPTITHTDIPYYRYFPKNVPIDLGTRTTGQFGHTANVDANGNILTISFKHANGQTLAFDASTAVAANVTLAVDIQRRNINALTKTANRDAFVKIRIANNVGGTSGPWCLGVPDIFRLKAVYIGNSSVSDSSPNVVKNFFIDHNQNANFYDLGWLYRSSKSTVALDSDDYLLVQFDYGTATGTGFYTTQSYTGTANALAVAVNDSLALANLGNQWNTFEIPEVQTDKGAYYDLLNQFDFRPYAVSTATPNTVIVNAPLNPTYSLSFGNTANPANDKKFPLPNTVFSTNVDQYMAHNESIFVNKDGRIFSKAGAPETSLEKLSIASTPSYSMRLADLYVPPYPNLPVRPSVQISTIVDTKVYSENSNSRRINGRTIVEKLTGFQTQSNQPLGYTMEEIGSLERRIESIEYYLSLSLLESDLKDRIIPSSIDPTISRFKYGFFADDFGTLALTQYNHKSYNATIEDDVLHPRRENIAMVNFEDGYCSCDYIEWPIVSQDNATGETSANCQPAGLIANTWALRQYTNDNSIHDTTVISLSSTTGPVTLYGYFTKGTISIKQGNTVIKTANDAVGLSSADRAVLFSNAVPSSWFYKLPTSTANASVISSEVRNGLFKISFTHAPAAGQTYTIDVNHSKSEWRYAIEYPINSTLITCETPTVPVTPDTGTTVPDTPTPVVYSPGFEVIPDIFRN